MLIFLQLFGVALLLLGVFFSGAIAIDFTLFKVRSRGAYNNLAPEFYFLRILCYGILWFALFFALAFLISGLGFEPGWWWGVFFVFTSIVCVFTRIVSGRKEFAEYIAQIEWKVFGYLLCWSIFLQAISLSFYPNVLDSVQLGWTGRFVDSLNLLEGRNTGAVGFSALIFFCGLLLPAMPLAVSASAFKILIYYALCVVIYIFAKAFFGRNTLLGVLAGGACLLGSYFGIAAFWLGKDSTLGVLLSAAYIGILALPDVSRKHAAAALCCGTAAITGVISVPFMAFVALFYFILARDWGDKLSFLFWHFLLALPLLAFPLQAMLAVPLWVAPVAALPLAGTARLILIKVTPGAFPAPRLGFWIPVLLLLSSFFFSMKFLPVLKVLPGGAPEIMAPLDGKTGFVDLIFSYSASSGFLGATFLIGGFIALYLMRKQDPAKWVGAFYLQAALAVFLWLCHIDQNLFDNWNLWDLVKDCMWWYLPFTAMVCLGPILARISLEPRLLPLISPLLVLVLGGSALQSAAINHGFLGAKERYGYFQLGARDRILAEVAEQLWLTRGAVVCHVDPAVEFSRIGTLEYFCPRTVFVDLQDGVALSDPVDGRGVLSGARRMLLASPSRLDSIKSANPLWDFQTLATFQGHTLALFEVVSVDRAP
jgi:hypothetical protein